MPAEKIVLLLLHIAGHEEAERGSGDEVDRHHDDVYDCRRVHPRILSAVAKTEPLFHFEVH
jgi:hypothetical protein